MGDVMNSLKIRVKEVEREFQEQQVRSPSFMMAFQKTEEELGQVKAENDSLVKVHETLRQKVLDGHARR